MSSESLSLEEVRDKLIRMPDFNRKEVHHVISRLKVHADEIKRYIQWSDEGYTRTRYHEDERFQMLVLAWSTGQVSPIHDHCDSICSMHVVSGTCESINFSRASDGQGPMKRGQAVTLEEGMTTTVYGGDIHTIGCPEDCQGGLVTLHCYLPSIPHMLIFDEATGRSVRGMSQTLEPLPAG